MGIDERDVVFEVAPEFEPRGVRGDANGESGGMAAPEPLVVAGPGSSVPTVEIDVEAAAFAAFATVAK